MNEQQIEWDDFQTVLAIAEGGSLSGAARRLGVSHATVFRRLGAIESGLGIRLFQRRRTGYTPTPAGEDVAAAAKRIESEVLGVERRVAGRDLLPSGSLRVTTTDTLLEGLLSPIVAEFRRSYPDISLEIAVSNVLFSLSRREADVAVRPTLSPPENLVGRRIGTLGQAVYGSADRHTRSGDAPDLSAFEWVGPDEGMAYTQLASWMSAQGLNGQCRYRVDTLQGMRAGVRDGIGVAVLPCYLGDGDERLVRLTDALPELATELWLLTHPDLRRVARIRAFMELIAAAIGRMERVLAGL